MEKRLLQKTTAWERCNHWILALSFIVLFLTGLGFLYQSLNWINTVFGGNHLAKEIHRWGGLVFAISLILTMGNYFAEAVSFTEEDKKWLSSLGGYFSRTEEPPPQGRLNAGQKLFYLVVVLIFGLAISLSGFMLWFFNTSRGLILFAHFLHNLSYIVFAFAVPLHIYLSTAANPGTLRVMTRGTVSAAWAKKHHGKWARDMGVD